MALITAFTTETVKAGDISPDLMQGPRTAVTEMIDLLSSRFGCSAQSMRG